MTSHNPPSVPVPTAAAQTSLEADRILHSGNCGLIIHRTGQLRNELRSEGREFAREVAEHVNRTQVGVTTIFIYEEAFGVHDRIHWLIHMNGLTDYLTLVGMAVGDENFRNIFFKERIPAEKGGGDWSRIFPDGSVRERVLVPLRRPATASGEAFDSATAGMVVERTGIVRHGHRDQALETARAMAEHVNRELAGVATVRLYEERFGRRDRLHWLIHLRDLTSYERLAAFRDEDEGFRRLARSGDGPWETAFVEGSLKETVLLPQFAGSQGTAK